MQAEWDDHLKILQNFNLKLQMQLPHVFPIYDVVVSYDAYMFALQQLLAYCIALLSSQVHRRLDSFCSSYRLLSSCLSCSKVNCNCERLSILAPKSWQVEIHESSAQLALRQYQHLAHRFASNINFNLAKNEQYMNFLIYKVIHLLQIHLLFGTHTKDNPVNVFIDMF